MFESTSAIELLQRLEQFDETNQLEVKTASQVGDSLLETICAFANEPHLGGGYILLGVSRDENTLFAKYYVQGIRDSDKLQTEIATRCANDFNIAIRPHISLEEVSEQTVMVLYIPEASPNDKPIYFKSKGLPRGAYRRIGSADIRCTDEDLAIFYQGRNHQAFDLTVLTDAEFEDLNPAAITEYRKLRARVNVDGNELELPDEKLLLSLNCGKYIDGVFRPNIAGILLFGSRNALRRFLPMMRVDYLRLPANEWIADPINRYESLEIRDAILLSLPRAMAAVVDDLTSSFFLPEQGLQSIEQPILPTRVLREAIVNALMHRSYQVHNPIQILRYPNRLEIRNAGFSLKPIEHYHEAGSFTRNPTIAAVLHDINIAETRGTGASAMRKLMEKAGLTVPLFSSDRSGNQFISTFLFHHFLEEKDVQWLALFQDLKLSDEEAKALIFVREVGSINNQYYRDMNTSHTLDASQHLRRLRDAGLLEQKGKGSATYYVPGVRFRQSLSDNLEPLSDNLEPLSDNLEPLSDNLEPLSDNLESIRVQLPSHLQELVHSVGLRANNPNMRNIVLQLCAWKPLSANDIGAILKREPRYVVDRYLKPLIVAKLLEYTIPETPNHPHQAYKTIQQNDTFLETPVL
jgi:ATP-dependent DNA helicase RecG